MLCRAVHLCWTRPTRLWSNWPAKAAVNRMSVSSFLLVVNQSQPFFFFFFSLITVSFSSCCWSKSAFLFVVDQGQPFFFFFFSLITVSFSSCWSKSAFLLVVDQGQPFFFFLIKVSFSCCCWSKSAFLLLVLLLDKNQPFLLLVGQSQPFFFFFFLIKVSFSFSCWTKSTVFFLLNKVNRLLLAEQSQPPFSSSWPAVPAGSPSRGGDVVVYVCNMYHPNLPTPFYFVLVSISVFMALSTVVHSKNSPDNSPFSHSVLSVLTLPYWSFQLYVSSWKSPSALI